jgi:glycopeptide antibiotics resistance protein
VRFLLYGPIPLLAPGIVVSLIVGAVAAGQLSRLLRVAVPVAFLLIASLGIIVSATVTPLRGAIEFGATGAGSCDVSRIVPLAPTRWLTLSEPSLNIAMFVPLGVAIGLVPRSRVKAILIAAALALPFAIELIQLSATALARGCETADMIDNLTGLVVGLALGALIGWLVSRWPSGGPASSADADPIG